MNKTDKKAWEKPELYSLSIRETKAYAYGYTPGPERTEISPRHKIPSTPTTDTKMYIS